MKTTTLISILIIFYLIIGLIANLSTVYAGEAQLIKQIGFYNYTKDLETISKNKGETPEGQSKLTNQEILNVIQIIVTKFKDKGIDVIGIESDRNLIWVYGVIKQPEDNPLPPKE